jgi:hypothetical protein
LIPGLKLLKPNKFAFDHAKSVFAMALQLLQYNKHTKMQNRIINHIVWE